MRASTAAARAAIGLTVFLASALAGCAAGSDDPRGSRDPDAVGTVAAVDTSGGGVSVGFIPDPGYEYFAGTIFAFDADGDLESASGEAAGPGDVAVGDRIEVWVEACAESFPVQCADPVGRLLP